MGYFYRAVNEHEISNNHNGYLCNLNIHKDDNEKMKKAFKKIINEVFGKNLIGDFSLAIDRIIGHINGKNLNYSLWISTSKDFNYVAREYTIPQNGNYNIDDYRKEIIVIKSDRKIEVENDRNSRNASSFSGKFIDVSNHRLKEYNKKGLILPYAQNKNSSAPLSEILKSFIIDENGNLVYKRRIDGFDNFAYSANEVLFFDSINKDDIALKLNPLMQDIIYTYTHDKSIEETNKLVFEIYKRFHDKDFRHLLSKEELNIYNYLYVPHEGKYNSLITLINNVYLNSYDIEQAYEILKMVKRGILMKITGLNSVSIVDDDIYVINSIEEAMNFSDKKKHDIIYCLDHKKNLLVKQDILKECKEEKIKKYKK